MSSYSRRGSASNPEMEAITNPKSVDDLKIALLNPLSKASQMQRNLEWQQAEHYVFIEKLIQLTVAQQLKVEERERKILVLQQVVAQLEKDKQQIEAEQRYIDATAKAEQNQPTVSIQLTVREWQDKIDKQKQQIAVTQQNIQNLNQQIATIGQQKNLLQQSWQNLKQAQISQYQADLKNNNVPLKTASGKTIDPDSKAFQDLMDKVFKMSPSEFMEQYGKARDQIVKAYANQAQSQPPPIATTQADIMAQKEMPMPAPEQQAAVQEQEKTTQAAAQPELEKEPSLDAWRLIAMTAELAEGATGEKLQKFMIDSKPALAQFAESLKKAEQDLEAQNTAAAAADTETPDELKKYKYAAKNIGELASDLHKKEKQATADLESEQQKLAKQQAQLSHDEQALEQTIQAEPE